jgi:mono/diheme cytochrome c family protein
MKIVTTIALTILFLIFLGLIFMYSGIYNVAADEPDNPLIAWAMKTTREHSIDAGTDQVNVPADLASVPSEEGMKHYHTTCEMCHGAPGIKQSEIGKGLYPKPPELHKEARELTPETIFWIVKHGIKMSGMASFGGTHPDKVLLSIVAFVKKLPDMTAEEYKNLTREKPGKNSGTHH